MKIPAMRINLVILAFVVLTMPLAAQAITLQEAAQEAALRNPEVLSRWHAYRESTEGIDVAKGGYRPKVDLSAELGWERLDRSPGGDDSYATSGLGIFLNQMLFDGYATKYEVKRLNYAQRAVYYAFVKATEDNVLETMRAYNDVLRYRKLKKLAEDNYVQHRAIFEQLQRRVKAGVGRRVDLEQASGRLALAESNLLTETSNLHDVSARYQRLVGAVPAAEMQEPGLLKAAVPDRLRDALYAAYKTNPGLLAAQENIVSAQAGANGARANFYPRLDLRASHNMGWNVDGLSDDTRDKIGLLLNYNLYNGGADQARQRQYWERVNIAKDLRDKECRDVRQTVTIAHNDIKKLAEQLAYLDQHQLSTEKARDAYRKQFDIGQRTLLDVLDSENELFEARRAYVAGLHDYAYAYARTQAGMGRLLNAIDMHGLEVRDLHAADEQAPFDPDAICPHEGDLAAQVDKDKLFADALSENPDLLPQESRALAKDADSDGVEDGKDKCPGTPAGTKVDQVGCPMKAIIDLKGVNFDYDKHDLRPDALPILDEALKVLQRYPELRIEVAGHTDYFNTEEYNQALSERRAKAVREYFVSKGIAADRMTAKGYGESQPIADNETPEGQSKNRRVELRVLNK